MLNIKTTHLKSELAKIPIEIEVIVRGSPEAAGVECRDEFPQDVRLPGRTLKMYIIKVEIITLKISCYIAARQHSTSQNSTHP